MGQWKQRETGAKRESTCVRKTEDIIAENESLFNQRKYLQ